MARHLHGHVVEDPGAVVRQHLLIELFLGNEVLWTLSPARRSPLQDAAIDGLLLQFVCRNVFQVKDDVLIRLDQDLCRGTILASPGEKGKRLENQEVVVLWEVSNLKITSAKQTDSLKKIWNTTNRSLCFEASSCIALTSFSPRFIWESPNLDVTENVVEGIARSSQTCPVQGGKPPWHLAFPYSLVKPKPLEPDVGPRRSSLGTWHPPITVKYWFLLIALH